MTNDPHTLLRPMNPILVVDDIRTNLLFIENSLKKAGYTHILACQNSSEVLDVLSGHLAELILLDLRMPHPDGLTLLPRIRESFPDLPVIIVTDVDDVKTAVQCMRHGAFDYITKPVDQDLFKITIDRAMAFRRLNRENSVLRKTVLGPEDLENPEAFSGIITAGGTMLKVFHTMEAVAKTEEPVLITGDTGTGKEKAARVIHALSGRPGRLVTVNVAGLDDSMFADTLFGHVKGAFTGADNARPGLVEAATDGTLFLDEIGELSSLSQVKLLRLLQEKEYMALGSDDLKHCRARIVVATHADLWDLEKKGRFRKDLIYRLKTHHIHIPALSERSGDIPLLTGHFISEAARRLNRDAPTVPDELQAMINALPFPGNVRELQSMVFDAVSRCRTGILEPGHFTGLTADLKNEKGCDPKSGQVFTASLSFPDPLPTLKQAVDALVKEAMKRSGGKQTLAASMLGISQPALHKRLKK